MRVFLILFAVFLTACDHAPALSGVEASAKVEVRDHMFLVHYNETKAILTRQSRYFKRDKTPVFDAGILAAEIATGCPVKPETLRDHKPGHANQFTVKLACRKGQAPPFSMICEGEVIGDNVKGETWTRLRAVCS